MVLQDAFRLPVQSRNKRRGVCVWCVWYAWCSTCQPRAFGACGAPEGFTQVYAVLYVLFFMRGVSVQCRGLQLLHRNRSYQQTGTYAGSTTSGMWGEKDTGGTKDSKPAQHAWEDLQQTSATVQRQ